jgi:hypothetical protein
VELNEFQILQWETSSDDHGVSVTGTGVGTGTTEVCSTVTTGGQDSLVRPESVKGSILHVQGENTNTFTILHQQVEGKVLNEEVGVVS